MQEHFSKASVLFIGRTRDAGLTRDRIRHVSRAPGGGKGDDRDCKKSPAQPESTRSKDFIRFIFVPLAQDAARVAV
jgi:hypothetical protein